MSVVQKPSGLPRAAVSAPGTTLAVIHNGVTLPAQVVAQIEATKQRVAAVEYMMSEVLKSGVDYGKIPGTPKPTLYQPGADAICMMFGWTARYEEMSRVMDLDRSPAFVLVSLRCQIVDRNTGEVMGEGVGSCNSQEVKYRYRTAWEEGRQVKRENVEVMDLCNTLEKMAAKRAKVAAALAASGAARIFTQDLEDIADGGSTMQEEDAPDQAGQRQTGAGRAPRPRTQAPAPAASTPPRQAPPAQTAPPDQAAPAAAAPPPPPSAPAGKELRDPVNPAPVRRGGDNPSTAPQRTKLYASATAAGLSDEQAKAAIKTVFGVDSAKDLTTKEAGWLIDWLLWVEAGHATLDDFLYAAQDAAASRSTEDTPGDPGF